MIERRGSFGTRPTHLKGDEEGLLTPEALEEVYQYTKAEAYKYSELYEGTLSPKNYHPERPADRERQFCISRKDTLMRNAAKAQQALTASIKDAKYNKLLEDYKRIKTDRVF